MTFTTVKEDNHDVSVVKPSAVTLHTKKVFAVKQTLCFVKTRVHAGAAVGRLLLVGRDRETLAALRTAVFDHIAPALGLHASPKPVGSKTVDTAGLVGTLRHGTASSGTGAGHNHAGVRVSRHECCREHRLGDGVIARPSARCEQPCASKGGEAFGEARRSARSRG